MKTNFKFFEELRQKIEEKAQIKIAFHWRSFVFQKKMELHMLEAELRQNINGKEHKKKEFCCKEKVQAVNQSAEKTSTETEQLALNLQSGGYRKTITILKESLTRDLEFQVSESNKSEVETSPREKKHSKASSR